MLQPRIRTFLPFRQPPSRLPRHGRPYSSTSTSTSTSSTSSIPPPPPRPNRFSAYLTQLRLQHPHLDPASLIASFLILHELTAIVPLLLGFWGFKSLGLGRALVEEVQHITVASTPEREQGYFKAKLGDWLLQGEEQAKRLGTRYGWFGMEKLDKEQRAELSRSEQTERDGHQDQGRMRMIKTTAKSGTKDLTLSGDVANLVASYVVVKALLPLRIYASLRLAPKMANTVMQRFHRLRAMGKRYLSKQNSAVGGPGAR
ncbi:hypothetical protein MVLG_03667 [Microbotryum lychnidis-dioicae p1A1 Lamole]|uniref:Uncharacterized protein n=1 Tax=Microbotryum lychnidis-dioicae (strain p1A1 Lamole / MvSl-1064) TaxID=683840 RepID=U5H8W9_USTV1|nr:hypothetical protein MVLG_03667 [Microbotryum lychnidis-dioicae p1A1 Lamole]|eukprot:KDE05982.1 hypothetical protein MVLG_03667 [Microbotryum lychnidis-dioicae p1A1 Lamole]